MQLFEMQQNTCTFPVREVLQFVTSEELKNYLLLQLRISTSRRCCQRTVTGGNEITAGPCDSFCKQRQHMLQQILTNEKNTKRTVGK